MLNNATVSTQTIPIKNHSSLVIIDTLNDLPNRNTNVFAVLTGVRLLGFAPAAIEQSASRRHAGRRWRALRTADRFQRRNRRHGMGSRQRSDFG
jgi:hypothetical protein